MRRRLYHTSLDFSFALQDLCGSCSKASLARLRSLLLVNIATLVLSLIAAVVVPTTLTAIIVVPQDQSIHSSRAVFGIRDVSHTVELFPDSTLNEHVLLVLMVLSV